MSVRIVRQNPDLLAHRLVAEVVTKVVPDVAVSLVDSEVAWVPAVVLEEAAKSMSPTFPTL
jgi:hypothetical protein